MAVFSTIENFTSLQIETTVKDWMIQNEIGMVKVSD
jgi:hypothetical protein